MTDTHTIELTPTTLAGKRVAITGANRGIGLGIARAVAAAGASVLVQARTAEKVEATVAAVAASQSDPGAALIGVTGDLTDHALGEQLASAATASLGGLDALILNAGMLGTMGPLEGSDFDEFDHVMRVNVTSQARLFSAALPLLLASGGQVLWMSSGLGRFALPRFGAYCASKHAVEGLARLAAVEHGEQGLTSIAIAPGMVQTEMLSAAMEGGDTSEHPTADQVGAGFARLLATLGADANGESLDIGPYLAP